MMNENFSNLSQTSNQEWPKFWTVKLWAPILSRQQDLIPDYNLSTSTKYNEDRYMMNRTTKESEISNYFTDWRVQWSSILFVCRKVGSVYCLRGSKTNLFGLPFVWDSVRQFDCVSDRYSYQSFSRDEIDLKWSSQE